MNAAEFRPIVVAYRNGAPVRLDQVANVIDSVENVFNGSWFYTKDGRQGRRRSASITLQVMRQPGTQHHRGHRRRPRAAAVVRGAAAAVGAPDAAPGSLADDPRGVQRHPVDDARHAAARRRRDLPVPAQRLGDAHSGAGAAVLDPRHVRRDAGAELQPEQPVDDGADPLDRLRRRRRDRDAREHRAAHGGRARRRSRRRSRARRRSASRFSR